MTDVAVPPRSRRNIGGSSGSNMIQQWLGILATLLRIVLYPLRVVLNAIMPPGEFDGLSPAVTAKAAQHFVSYLKSISASSAQAASISELFVQTGFAAVKDQAMATNSLIFVYIHSPLHSKAKETCEKLISSEMLAFLNQNNLVAFGVSISTAQGVQLSQSLHASAYPCLALLQPSSRGSGSLQLVFKVEGPEFIQLSVARLLPLLQGTFRCHQVTVAEQETQRLRREEEAALRRQQDEEYQEALRADQERDRRRREEEEEQARLERERREEEAEKERIEKERLDNARSVMRPEPTSGGTRIRFVLPSGQKLDRRFENDETVGALRAFLVLHFAETNPNVRNLGLSTNFPKKSYSDDGMTLEESGISPQAVIMVQDLDA